MNIEKMIKIFAAHPVKKYEPELHMYFRNGYLHFRVISKFGVSEGHDANMMWEADTFPDSEVPFMHFLDNAEHILSQLEAPKFKLPSVEEQRENTKAFNRMRNAP